MGLLRVLSEICREVRDRLHYLPPLPWGPGPSAGPGRSGAQPAMGHCHRGALMVPSTGPRGRSMGSGSESYMHSICPNIMTNIYVYIHIIYNIYIIISYVFKKYESTLPECSWL